MESIFDICRDAFMDHERIIIDVNPEHRISSIWSVPLNYKPGAMDAVILAHGAGNDMEHPFMVNYQKGLAQAGLLSIRFNFPYKELGRKAPDKPALLLQTWTAIVEAVRCHTILKPRRLFLAGKSMGGRIASMAVAEGLPCDGLILLGYPLHPPKQPEKARTEHWSRIACPSLFIQGTRDALCHLDLLEASLLKLSGPSTLISIQGGDHSFRAPKNQNPDSERIHADNLREITDWIQKLPL